MYNYYIYRFLILFIIKYLFYDFFREIEYNNRFLIMFYNIAIIDDFIEFLNRSIIKINVIEIKKKLDISYNIDIIIINF